MKFKNFIYAFVIISLLSNCSSSSDDESMTPQPDPDPTEKVTYTADIKSIIDGNCISCHGATPSNGAPMSLTTYTQVKNNVNNIISRINSTSNPMPPSPNSPLSSTQKSLIQQWKDDGLLEN